MAYQPVEDLLSKAEHNVYKLTAIASQRAKELANGKPKLIDAPAGEKSATTALREIAAGKVMLKAYADSLEKKPKKKES